MLYDLIRANRENGTESYCELNQYVLKAVDIDAEFIRKCQKQAKSLVIRGITLWQYVSMLEGAIVSRPEGEIVALRIGV